MLKAKTNDLVKLYDQHRSELWLMVFMFHFRCFTETALPRQLTWRTSRTQTGIFQLLLLCSSDIESKTEVHRINYFMRNQRHGDFKVTWQSTDFSPIPLQLTFDHTKDLQVAGKHFHLDERYVVWHLHCSLYHDFGECAETEALYIREGKLERHNLCLTQLTGLLSLFVIINYLFQVISKS